MTRRLSAARPARTARPVIDAHGHLLVPEANALADGHPGEAADAAAERASFTEASIAANQAQIGRVWPQLTDVGRRLADLDAIGVDAQVVGPDADAPVLGRAGAGGQAHDRDQRGRRRALRGRARAGCTASARCRCSTRRSPSGSWSAPSASSASRASASPPTSTAASSPTRVFDPVWAAAADLGAVVFIHPWGCSLGPRLGAHFLGNTFGQPAETALALSHLIFGGTLDRHPGLKLLAAHGGGFLPTYIGRSDHAWAERPDARGCAYPPSAYLRRIWYDALVYSPQALRHLVEVVGSDKVMLGTDYPFDMGVTDPVERASAAGLPAADLTAVLSGNAAALFGIG